MVKAMDSGSRLASSEARVGWRCASTSPGRAKRSAPIAPASTISRSPSARVPSSTRWEKKFDSVGVAYTPTIDEEYGHVLNFKDPDNIALEVFALRAG